MPWLWIVVVLVMIVVALIALGVRAVKRGAAHMQGRERLQREFGWDYAVLSDSVAPLASGLPASHKPKDSFWLEASYEGVDGQARNVLSGRLDGYEIVIFDYVARPTSAATGGRLPGAKHTVWAVKMPQVPFWVQAATKAQRFEADHGMGTWFATGDEEFDEKYRVTADAGPHVVRALPPNIRRMTLDSGVDGWRLDGEHQHLLVWLYGRFASPEEVVDYGHAVVRLAAVASRREAWEDGSK